MASERQTRTVMRPYCKDLGIVFKHALKVVGIAYMVPVNTGGGYCDVRTRICRMVCGDDCECAGITQTTIKHGVNTAKGRRTSVEFWPSWIKSAVYAPLAQNVFVGGT